MEQKYKDLLLQDLCGRLPYKVKASYYGAEEECECWDEVEGIVNDYVEIGQYSLPIEAVKPYLFPLSSMTEEQKKEWQSLMIRDPYGILYYTIYSYDYLYKNHIDIRGLIPKGLANDATGLNVY